MKKKITRGMIERWMGDDALPSDYIEVLWELVNDHYEVEQMKQDIINTDD